MKLPFSLALQFVFARLFPGAVVALALLPLEWFIVTSLVMPAEPSVSLVASIFFWGWVIVLMDMPIYMLFEGRRFWPERVRRYMHKREKHRLGKILELSKQESAHIDYNKYLEAVTEKHGFPITEDGSPYAEYRTRLGNALSSFEVYPDVKYGMPAQFYVSRLWVKLEPNLRNELDNAQAIADSGIYMAFALYFLAFWILSECIFSIDFHLYHISQRFYFYGFQ